MWKFATIIAVSLLWAIAASGGFGESKKTKTGCNNTLHLNNSKFELNVHNLTYPCYWQINVTGTINLFFFEVFLDNTDYANIFTSYEDAENKTNPLLKNSMKSQNGTTTIITKESFLVVYLNGTAKNYDRVFHGYYSVDDCSVPLAPDVVTVYSPTYVEKYTGDKKLCDYRFNEIPHRRVMQAFTFEEFNMPSSTVKIEGSTLSSEEYTNEHHPTDFFIHDSILTISVTQAINSTDYFRLKIHEVDKTCSGKVEFDRVAPILSSPPDMLNNGTITAFECRWLVVSKTSTNKLGLKFDKLEFASVFDLVAVNDGRSEISPPLFQVTTSNRNVTQKQIIRAMGPNLWIAFKPLNFKSNFAVNITEHGQGGYFRTSGDIAMRSTDGDDTAFLLEVGDNEVVMLDFEDSSITPPATVSIYDGFDTNNMLASLHGQVKYPVFSRSSKMLVTGTNFSAKSNQFSAKFKGVILGCNHMSSSSSENYVLVENCNSSCLWIIPPQNMSSSALVVYLQYISLKEGDNLKIHKLDATLTQLVKIGSNETYVPHISVPSDVGILVNITQAACKKKSDKVILIGHSSYVPACNHEINSEASQFLQISSPLYPDTYPVFANCHWNISVPKQSIVHMAFQTMNLAKNHCIKIYQNSKMQNQYEGKSLPVDIFLTGDVLIDFDSSGCNKSQVGNTLNSDAGFLLNVTITDCGAILDGKKSGEFNTSIVGNKSICIWKVSVPPTEGSSVNTVSYIVSEKDKLKNYELHVYDGSSVRDSEIVNNTGLEIWSRTNTLIFVYKRLKPAQPSAVLQFKYNTINCGTLCENKVCMHPDWRCNGENECGDFSDERNCASVPIPPEVKYTGYSSTAFWLCIFAMVIIGVILGVTVPVCYQRYKDSRYRRFHELDT